MSNSPTRPDPATLQTASGMPIIKSMNDSFIFSAAEIERLRRLGARVAEIAAQPVQSTKAELWRKHNDLETTQPLVFIDPENGWNECIPPKTLECTTPMARVWEMFLLKQIYWFEVLKDDKVIEPYFDVPYSYSDTGWGVDLKRVTGGVGGSFKMLAALEDYEDDFPKIHYPELIIDKDESEATLALAHEIFDGILTVRRKTSWWWSLGMTRDFINVRGLENFMCDLIAEPEYVHRFMELLCCGTLNKLDFLQANGYLAHNLDGTYVGSGGFGFTSQLPQPDFNPDKVTTMDMWGLVESQETSSVSPEMYGEFIFPYHKRIAERFGLNCFGCCEAFNPRWKYAKQLPRLRRVSVSPWADLSILPEYLGRDYIASIKPNPSHLAQSVMDETSARHDIKKAVEMSDSCIVEIIMKDNHTLGNNPANAARWVEIAREEISRK